MNINEIDLIELKNKLDIIKKASEDVEKSLDTINNEIVESVGTSGRAWDGEDAIKFRKNWDLTATNIKNFKMIITNQVNNIESIIEKMAKTEE